jgi:GNAT superfamily N-acetyltransferase
MSTMVTVADCERVQANWFRFRAETLGGQVWSDGPMTWIHGPDGVNLMFPSAVTTEGAMRGVARAREHGLSIVGAWLGLDVDASPLAAAGFERGWSPWWMTVDLDSMPLRPDPRVELRQHNDDYPAGWDYPKLLATTRVRPARTWYAAAYTDSHEFAGHGWSFLDGDLAGIFDMEVWDQFQRRGLGTGLLHAVCAAARAAGARHAVLNATPQGKLLYDTCGFRQIGEGITWWHHLRTDQSSG